MISSAVNNSSAFGFSILITATFGMLSSFQAKPDVAQIVWFALGAVLPFSLLEAAASRGFRRRPSTQGQEVVMLGTAANLVSVAAGLGVAYLISALLHGTAAWIVAPMLTGAVYMLVEAAELAVAEAIEGKVFGEDEAEGRAES
ncbi:MAG: hypothetical protein ACRDMV_22315 [Streptosporangiales bacterium]